MQIKIEKYYQWGSAQLQRFNDIRFTGQMVFAIIVLLITWSGVKSVQSNYALQKQITGLKQQNNVQQLENNNLQLQNEYYNSKQYLELSARQNFGLAAPGEKEIVVPASVALSYTKNLPAPSDGSTDVQAKQPSYQKNFESWVNFFLHRQSQD